MKVLLDTHAFIWWVTNDPQLSNTAKGIIANPKNTVVFSVVSAWEIIIKQGIGKLTLPEPAETYVPSRIAANRFSTLNVSLLHILKIASLPNLHKDPFDRLLIAQSQSENIPLISIGRRIAQYPISILW